MPDTDVLNLQDIAAAQMPRTAGVMETVEVAAHSYLMIDGEGDPESSAAFSLALNWLYGLSYSLKFTAKAAGNDYHIGSLEGLWRAKDMDDFRAGRRERWQWTMMIMQPDFVSAEDVAAAIAKVGHKLGEQPSSLRLSPYGDGLCVQVLHVGPFSEEGPVIARLHREYLPEHRLEAAGDHHEIYLADPRRVPPSKMRTLLRQPVRQVAAVGAPPVDKTAALA